MNEEDKYKKKYYGIYLILLTALVLSMIIYSIVWLVDYNRNYGFFVRTKAEVVGTEIPENSGRIVKELEYFADGAIYRIAIEDQDKYDIGDKFSVFYDENNPIGIIYNRDVRYYLLPIATILLLIIDIGFAVIYFSTYYRKTSMHSGKKSLSLASDDRFEETRVLENNVKPYKYKLESSILKSKMQVARVGYGISRKVDAIEMNNFVEKDSNKNRKVENITENSTSKPKVSGSKTKVNNPKTNTKSNKSVTSNQSVTNSKKSTTSKQSQSATRKQTKPALSNSKLNK